MTMLDHAVIWHLYPLTATGAAIRESRRPGRGLGSLKAWLDYAVELGCDTILLAPIFASQAHGYDTLNHYEIDDRLGGQAEFDAFMQASRARGLKVLLDGVFNHVAAEHPWVSEGQLIKRDDAGSPVGWEGHDSLVELDHANPQVADEVVAIMEHWLAQGISGWRLDVAYAVPNEFWADVTGRVRENYPDAVFLGEVIHGDYTLQVTEGHLDAVTQYELWKAIHSSIADTNFFELTHALGRHNDFLAAGHMQTFVGNHDVDRIASLVGDEGAALAVAVLLSLPGVPSIYHGDEQAFRGMRGEGYAADDAVRPELPLAPEELARVGQWMYEHHQRLIGFRRRHAWLQHARVEVQETSNETLSYRVTDGEHHVDVNLSLTDGTSVTMRADDGEEFVFSA